MTMKEAIAKVVDGRDLAHRKRQQSWMRSWRGRQHRRRSAVSLTALRMKGETPEEIAAFARVMRNHAVSISPQVSGVLVDTCGTGRRRRADFQHQHRRAFVAAGAGVPVVKHGNRGVSSRCGSADVLAALGVTIGN